MKPMIAALDGELSRRRVICKRDILAGPHACPGAYDGFESLLIYDLERSFPIVLYSCRCWMFYAWMG